MIFVDIQRLPRIRIPQAAFGHALIILPRFLIIADEHN